MQNEKEILKLIKQKNEEINELKKELANIRDNSKTPEDIEKEKSQREKTSRNKQVSAVDLRRQTGF